MLILVAKLTRKSSSSAALAAELAAAASIAAEVETSVDLRTQFVRTVSSTDDRPGRASSTARRMSKPGPLLERPRRSDGVGFAAVVIVDHCEK